MDDRVEAARMRSAAELLAAALELADEVDSISAVRIDEALLQVRAWVQQRHSEVVVRKTGPS